MDEQSLVAVLFASVVILWWWPTAPVAGLLSSAKVKSVDGAQALAQLRAELMSASDFASAAEATRFDASVFSLRTQQRLSQISMLHSRYGSVSSVLLDAIIEDEQCERELLRRWSAAVAGAHSSSIVLIVMPVLMWLIAQGLGTPAVSWLVDSAAGFACLIAGGLLIGLSRFSLRRLETFALNKRKIRSASSARRVLTAEEAANLVFLLALFLKPDVLGIAIALATRGALGRYWSRLPARASAEKHSDVSWLCAVLAANLHAGLDWLRSVRIAAELDGSRLSADLNIVAQRLEWGLEPTEAFVGISVDLDPVLLALAQTRRSGAPITEVLVSRSHAIRIEAHGRGCERVEKLGAAAVVPVAALQLPAFVLLGLVPFVAAQLGPMLSGFSSTGL